MLSQFLTVNAGLVRACMVPFVFLSVGLVGMGQGAIAQVTPDQTLSNPSQVRTSGSTATITGGTTAGSNLFHSFSQFSVLGGTTAFFDNNVSVTNILARVTGNQFSLINGSLQANGSANLFLINPNGIVFGPNAALSLGGSFVASTANSFNFADGLEYSAIDPQAAPLLAVNVPVGLQYGKGTQPITAIGSSLTVSPGKTFALVGGDVSLKGATLRARGGRIDLGGLSDTGTVDVIFDSNIPSFNFFKETPRSNISLINSDLQVIGAGGGNIAVAAKNISISDNSTLIAGIRSGNNNKAGNIKLSASDQIIIEGGIVSNQVGAQLNGDGGDISITAKSLFLKNGAQVSLDNYGNKNTGNINISSSDSIVLSGVDAQGYSSGLFSEVTENAQDKGGRISVSTKSLVLNNQARVDTRFSGKGNGGDVSIFVESLSLSQGAQLLSGNLGSGNGGNININASDFVALDGTDTQGSSSSILSTLFKDAQGSAGNIVISTTKLRQNNGAIIANNSLGRGDAGNISIIATDTIELSGAQTNGVGSAITLFARNDSGNGQDINISTGSLTLSGGGLINFLGGGKDSFGKIIINASNFIHLDGVGLFGIGGISNTATSGSGDIIIHTKSLRIADGASIDARQTSTQTTGNIDIVATESINILGASQAGKPSEINSSTFTNLPSGNITINTPILNIFHNGKSVRPGIQAISFGTGDAGNIIINSGAIMLDGGQINSDMAFYAIGDGGNIEVTANSLTAIRGGRVSTSTFSRNGGNTGNINFLLSDSLNLFGSRSQISSNAELFSTGKGGNIFINAPKINIANGAAIFVYSVGSGAGGSIDLRAGSLNLDNGIILASTASSNGGNVTLGVQNLFLANNNSTVSAAAGGNGNGGNLDLTSGFTVLNNNSKIAANAFQGQGGNIQITTQGLFPSRNSTISASSDLGINGTVQLTVTDPDPSRGLFSLPETVVDASGLVSQKCDATISKDSQKSEFIVTGRGGIPPNPSEFIQDESILSEWATLHSHSGKSTKQPSVTIAPLAQTTDTITIAQGWKTDSDGTVVLTAEPSSTSATTISTWQPAVKCRA